MRKFLTVTLALMFVLGLSRLALAGNTATVDQTSPDNKAIVTQTGSDNVIDVVQDNPNASSWNYADISQNGEKNLVDIYQKRAAGGNDYLGNIATVKQLGSDNWLVGAGCGGINSGEAATQRTEFGRNDLWVTQDSDGNKIGLYQKGLADNSANITQTGGGNSLGAYQWVALGLSNILVVEQSGSNEATICQLNYAVEDRNWAYLFQYGEGNIVDIYQKRLSDGWLPGGNNAIDWFVQDGNYNKLVGADSYGTIVPSLPATQTTDYGYQRIRGHQRGDRNEIGLYQEGLGDNEAAIWQTGGENSLGAYQRAPGGYNLLEVTQGGNASATVVQTATSGSNEATINQS